jgi:hypothetical protein
MRAKNLALLGAVFLSATSMFGATYWGGLEDWNGLDNDYNDVVFSLSGNNLSLTSNAQWFNRPTLGASGTPFWNHDSLDAPNDNVGFCIYGGGSCNGGAALASNLQFLASNLSSTGSANDVTFSANGVVTLNVAVQITSAKDILGWYALSDPSTINWLNADSSNGSFKFTPGTAFGLVGANSTYQYYSQASLGSQDAVSHFAFFGEPVTSTPEPGSLGLLSITLLAGVGLLRRRAH